MSLFDGYELWSMEEEERWSAVAEQEGAKAWRFVSGRWGTDSLRSNDEHAKHHFFASLTNRHFSHFIQARSQSQKLACECQVRHT